MKKIKILGAGLSGLSAAINLAKAGYEVEVYEKNKDCGMRFNGDLQGLENWSEKKDILEELKEMNLEINFDCDPFSKVTISNCYKAKDVYFEKPLFYLVKRGPFPSSIDYGLKEQALNLGVDINFEKTIPISETDIIASGPSLSKAFGITKGIIFKTDSSDKAIMLLNNNVAFKGYSYLLITKGYGCMATVVFDELNRINSCFEKTKEFFENEFKLDIKSPKELSGIGNFSLRNIFAKDGKLYVGEAAGLQDFLFGYGMRYAITSGYFAAKSIISKKDYKKIVEKKFKNKLRAGFVNRYIFEKIIDKNSSIIINKLDYLKKNLYSFYNYNLRQRIFYPLAVRFLKNKYPNLEL